MRKHFLRLVLIFILLLLVINLPITAKAEEKLEISSWDVDAQLFENGDISITEDIAFEFHDKYNGVYRKVILKGTSGISDIAVQEVRKDSLIDYRKVTDAENGDSEVFLVKEKKDKVIIQIFAPSKDQVRVFRLSYLVKNVATKYNDTGELYYQFLGKENETPIDQFEVNIKLPSNNKEDKISVFAHGPLHGTISKKNDIYILSVTDVPTGTYIEGRVLFPTELIPLSENIKNMDAYQNILEEEEAYRNKQVVRQQRKEEIRNVMEKASILLSGFGIVLLIIFFVLFRRNRKSYHNTDFAGIPVDCTPAIAARLFNNYISMNTLFATILDLYRKGYLSIKGYQNDIDITEKNQDYVITKLKEPDESLLSHEKVFCRWLFNEIGDGNTVSTTDIRDYGKNNRSAFTSSYNMWKKKIKEDAIQKGYYDTSKKKYGILLLIFSILLYVISNITVIYDSLYGIFGIFIAILLFIYGIVLRHRLSDEGYQVYRQWAEFKKRMKRNNKDLSIDDIRDRADSSLIYALALDVILKPEYIVDNKELLMDDIASHGWLIWYLLFVNEDSNPFQASMKKAFVAPISSGDFSGGGFSAGGGAGAGGGGAGGF